MSIVQTNFPQFQEYAVKTDSETEFVANSCDMFTDVGNFTFFLPYETLKSEVEKGGIFRYKKLSETSVYLDHLEELILDLSVIKILGYREHTVIIDKVKHNEIHNTKK